MAEVCWNSLSKFSPELLKHYSLNRLITSSDGDQCILETDELGNTTAKYTYGTGIDEVLTMERNSNTYFYSYDGLGSVTGITEETGALVEQYAYTVFGQVTFKNGAGNIISSSALGNPYLFTGRRYDSETGLYYYRARYYKADTGKFLQVDPLFTNSQYLYCENSAVNWIDPMGLFKRKNFELTLGVGGGVGYIIVGGGSVNAKITDLNTGEATTYTIAAIGVGVGLPQFGVTSKPIRFTVPNASITSADFEGYGYMGGASVMVGGGVTVGGGIKIPHGPFIPGKELDLNYGGVNIGVSHSVTYWHRR